MQDSYQWVTILLDHDCTLDRRSDTTPIPDTARLAAFWTGVTTRADSYVFVAFAEPQPCPSEVVVGAFAHLAATNAGTGLGFLWRLPSNKHLKGISRLPRSQPVSAQSMKIDSPEWLAANARRAALIRKKNRGGGLDPSEQAEFEGLQRMAVALVEAASPRPELLADALEAKLATKAGR